jgi:DNA modification methylase
MICDFFAGSGVIFEAAEQTETTAYGFEIAEDAVSLIGSRRGIYPEDI